MLKVLIAVDGSDHAERALQAVANMARASLELEAIVLCVSPEPLFYGSFTASTIQKIEDEQIIQQNAVLSKAITQAESVGLKDAEPARAYGVVANEIVRVAKDRQVDLIVMGTRGMGAMGNMLLGSVAQRVLHQAPVPVMLVK